MPGHSADVFRALGHSVRVEILKALLEDGEGCVCHLETRLGLRQAYLSQHLSRLRQAGLVTDRREGLNVFYRAVSPAVGRLLEAGERLEKELRSEPAPARTPRRSPHTAIDGCPCPRCQAPQPHAASARPALRPSG
jgi:ArsR family transcriptional regulator